ncbi:MAG TPA: membrane-associated protein [Planctomycetota bacterium]|nr:membrane-associated protein [Planctomycetota bacterium]
MAGPRKVPLWLKIAWTAWIAVWMPFYWKHYGPQNFLWFCDLANFLIAVALWTESSLLFSWQAVSVLLVQLVWTVDVVGRTLLGSRFLGTTDYMWDPAIPLVTRLLSLFHLAVPPLLFWGIWKLGYDRRAFWAQTVTAWVLLPICYFGWPPDPGFAWDINWVYGPFDKPQTRISPILYLGVCMIAYPVLLYAPTHFALRFLFRRREAAAPAG